MIGACVAGYSVYQMTSVSDQVDSMALLRTGVIRVLETSGHLEAVRRAETRYRLDQSPDALLEAKEQLGQALALARASDKMTLSDLRRPLYEELQRLIRSHEASFAQLEHLMTATAGARSALFDCDNELRGDVDKYVQATSGLDEVQKARVALVNAAVVHVRVASWRFQANNDPKGLVAFRKDLVETIAALAEATTADNQAIIDPMKTKLADYSSLFEVYAENNSKAGELSENKLKPEIIAMQAKLASASASLKDTFATVNTKTTTLLSNAAIYQKILAGAAFILGIILAFLIGRGIAGPISAMTAAMRRLAAQDMAVEIPGVGRHDEIGEMAGAVQVFKDNALQARTLEREQGEAQERRVTEDARVRREAELSAAAEAATLVVGSIGLGLERLAAGDLTFRLDTALPEAYETLRSNLNAAMTELQDVIRSIVTNTAGLRSGTEEITQASDDLSRRTEQQAASLEETAAALDQITATVRKTAEGAKQTQEVVTRTRADAELSGEVVRQAVAAMNGIDESSQQISQIIGVIDEIAFQTNLLALNAGVEAARAGDAGRGFAVVASEVRALAQRSAEAAREIKTLISASAKQVGAGVKLVGETGEALERIVTQVGEITVSVSEIAASAQEQATALHEVNTAINQMDQVTQQNAAMVEESTAASHTLAQETAELVRLTERFDVGDASRSRPNARPARRPAAPARPTKVASKAPSRGASDVHRPAVKSAPLQTATESWTEF
jgi:methyl-accepting chemotaxis protein